MVDPVNGNYQLQNNSPALGYGCQIFQNKSKYSKKSNTSISIDRSDRLSSQIVQGVLNGNQQWSADSILVNGNITIDSSATLNILPGTKIIFTGNYTLAVKGRITAKGTATQRIEFKHQNSATFTADTLLTNCWNGIEFYNTSTQSDSSKLEFCSFENVKYLPDNSTLPEYTKYGGAVRIFNFSNLLISNCIFKNNVAIYGTAISCFYQSNPQLISNLITQNKAKINTPAIFCAHSYPKIINNTITDNQIIVQIPFSQTAAVTNFISKPLFVNNILHNNLTYADQLWEFKDFYTHNNVIEDLENNSANLNTDPLFTDSLHYKLSENSPCRNAGTTQIPDICWPDYDLTGLNRLLEGSIDIGANEYTSASINQPAIPQITRLTSYPNPFNNSTIINFTLNRPGSIIFSVINLKGEELLSSKHFYPVSGKQQLNLSGAKLSSGIYFCQLKGDNMLINHRLLLLK